jgi:hypothetical protein
MTWNTEIKKDRAGKIFWRVTVVQRTKNDDSSQTKRPPGNGTAFSFKGE